MAKRTFSARTARTSKARKNQKGGAVRDLRPTGRAGKMKPIGGRAAASKARTYRPAAGNVGTGKSR